MWYTVRKNKTGEVTTYEKEQTDTTNDLGPQHDICGMRRKTGTGN